MPSTRPLESRPFARPARLLAAACLLAVPAVSLGQAASPAVSTVVAFNGSVPNTDVVQGGDGGLYGTTATTTNVTGGLVYRTNLDGSDVRTIYQLQNNQAYDTRAGLLVGRDGLLYGTTTLGAVTVEVNTTGTVFRLKTNGTDFSVIHRFAPWTTTNIVGEPVNTNGASPEAALIQASDGNLYGTTRTGGPNGTGVVFGLAPDGSGFKVLHKFGAITSAANSTVVTNADGIGPLGVLLEGADGKLYGTTSIGGVNGRGTIFRVAKDGTGFQTLYVFSALSSATPATNEDGATPVAGLTDGGNGRYYGVASEGGPNGAGTIFALDPATGLLARIHAFTDANGFAPSGALIVGRDGRLYGTTVSGGTNSSGNTTNLGTMFSIARDGSAFTKLYNFDNSAGTRPVGRLLQVNDTTFVGIASGGGNCGQGTLFHYSSTGAKVEGNTRCGQKKNNNGGGSTSPALLLLLGLLGLGRRWLAR